VARCSTGGRSPLSPPPSSHADAPWCRRRRALCQIAAPAARRDRTRCLLLDEPTSNLDLAHQGLVLEALRRQASEGVAVLAVMHDLNLAAALADELVLLVGGEIKASGPPRQVLRDGLLSAAYGCPVSTNRTPGGDRPFVLPPAVFFAQQAPAVRLVADAPDPQPAASSA
jgi:iron complex transport system ATP-binding protein